MKIAGKKCQNVPKNAGKIRAAKVKLLQRFQLQKSSQISLVKL
jgi:hypothetical protein